VGLCCNYYGSCLSWVTFNSVAKVYHFHEPENQTNWKSLILVKWPTWPKVLFYVFIYILNSLHVSSTSCSSSGETNCVNTTSGSCHSVSEAVSRAGPKWTSDLHTTRPPTATGSCIDTVCLSWWWAQYARNM